MEFRAAHGIADVIVEMVDIGTEWNLETQLLFPCLLSSSVDIGTEWNLEFTVK